MVGGYASRILSIDLRDGQTTSHFDEEAARRYVGGSGLAARLLWDDTTAETDPLSADSPLIFMTGPLTGTPLPKSSRYIVAGLSPLTGIWGEAHAGGDWADELKHAGFDGIVVRGKSEEPVYLWVHDGEVELRDARHLWGLDTSRVEALLRNETHQKASVAAIGTAGERLARIACIINDGPKGRAAARCGLGALMGSKKLKAIVARGTLGITVSDEARFAEGIGRIYSANPMGRHDELIETEIERLKSFITVGGAPVKNWTQGMFTPGYRLAEELRQSKPLFCRHCGYSCMESKMTLAGERHMVWEHWAPFGTNCLVDNAGALQQAYILCNVYGLDTISTGGVLAFAMECFEKGLISKKDTGGIDLRWGNHRAMLEMVRQIGEREGFGYVLGEGVKRAAEHIGGAASEYAMHVKGLELPAHDPRAANSFAVQYATSNLGASHTSGVGATLVEDYLPGYAGATLFPELGYSRRLDRFETSGKGQLTATMQNLKCMIDSLAVCMFLINHQRVQVSHFAELINAVTGWDMDQQEFMKTGERIFNLKRMFNVRRGISRKDDTLPPRMLSHRRGEGGAASHLPHLGEMLNEYYAHRGWSEEGIPTKETLTRLGLSDLLASMPQPLRNLTASL